MHQIKRGKREYFFMYSLICMHLVNYAKENAVTNSHNPFEHNIISACAFGQKKHQNPMWKTMIYINKILRISSFLLFSLALYSSVLFVIRKYMHKFPYKFWPYLSTFISTTNGRLHVRACVTCTKMKIALQLRLQNVWSQLTKN